MLKNSYGDIPAGTLAAVSVQTNGAYGNSAWQTARTNYYGISGTPTMWFDGATSVVGAGSTASAYSSYHTAYDNRRSAATDVTLQVGGRLVSGNEYEIKVKVGVEAGGTSKTMRIFIVQVIDNWPNAPVHTPRYGFMQAATTHGSEDQVTVGPGQFQSVIRNLTLSGDSLTHLSDVKIVVWAAPQATSNKVIYQSTVMHWPFTPLQVLGDLNGDYYVTIDDIPLFALALVDPAAYEALYPDVDLLEAADMDKNGVLNATDIQTFVGVVINDVTAPTPNPMTWNASPSGVPTPISTSAITMTATEATDPSGVEYYYTATGTGSHASGWIASRTYTDTGLEPNRSITYKVKARDLSPKNNTTADSVTKTAATYIETPTGLTVDVITDTTIQVTAPGTFTRLASNLSGLYFEVLDMAGNPVGGTDANAWKKVQTITATGLTAGTTYQFRVKARNYYSVETPWYPAEGYITATTTTTP